MHEAFLFSAYGKSRKQHQYDRQHIQRKTLVILFHYNNNILISKSKHNKNIYKPCLWAMNHAKLVTQTILCPHASNQYQP